MVKEERSSSGPLIIAGIVALLYTVLQLELCGGGQTHYPLLVSSLTS